MSSLVQIEAQGVRDAQGRFTRWEAGLSSGWSRSGRDAAEHTAEILKRHAPRGPDVDPITKQRRTHVADAIRVLRHNATNGRIEADIGTDAAPGRIIQYIRAGTSPHVITARRGKALRFFWHAGPYGAGVYSFRAVRHPGTKPNDFVAKALPEIRQAALDDLRRHVVTVAAT